ncbi:hypothetical protein BC834DRAFT_668835 [Gloeopeniophorella convolvens]|nr:hypothetical protein BC834DRAFT_668835 [Gloeopeniophorella convolvens]
MPFAALLARGPGAGRADARLMHQLPSSTGAARGTCACVECTAHGSLPRPPIRKPDVVPGLKEPQAARPQDLTTASSLPPAFALRRCYVPSLIFTLPEITCLAKLLRDNTVAACQIAADMSVLTAWHAAQRVNHPAKILRPSLKFAEGDLLQQ